MKKHKNKLNFFVSLFFLACLLFGIIYTDKIQTQKLKLKKITSSTKIIKKKNYVIEDKRLNRHRKLIIKYAKKYDINPYILAGIILQENCYKKCYSKRYGRNRGKSGEFGILQVMPMHVRRNKKRLHNRSFNMNIGTKYLAKRIKSVGLYYGISQYNTGPNTRRINYKYIANVLQYAYEVQNKKIKNYIERKKERKKIKNYLLKIL